MQSMYTNRISQRTSDFDSDDYVFSHESLSREVEDDFVLNLSTVI